MKRTRESYPLRSRKICELDRLHDDIFFYMERERLIEKIDLLMLAHAYPRARAAIPSIYRGIQGLFACAYASCDNDKQLEYICRGLTPEEKKARHLDAWLGVSLSHCDLMYHIDHVMHSKRPWRLSRMSPEESLVILVVCARTSNELFLDTMYNYGPKIMVDPSVFFDVTFLRMAVLHLKLAYLYSLLDDVRHDYFHNAPVESEETLWSEVIRDKEWDVLAVMLYLDPDPWNVNLLSEFFHANSKGAMRYLVEEDLLGDIDHALIQEGLDHDCLKSIKVLLDHGIEIRRADYADNHVSDDMRALLKW